MTAKQLNSYTVKDLGRMAKEHGVSGWSAMRKDQLVKALLKASRIKSPARRGGSSKSAATKKVVKSRAGVSGSRRPSSTKHTGKKHVAASRRSATRTTSGKPAASKSRPAQPKSPVRKPSTNGEVHGAAARKSPKTKNGVARKLQKKRAQHERLKNISNMSGAGGKDRLVVMVRDAFWLHVHWDLSQRSVRRAEAAMGQDWHTARPVLRLLQVSGGAVTSATEKVIRDIEIHGGVNNWYVDVKDSPKSYRLDIGYLAANNRFFALGRSNVVTTPAAGSSDAIDEHWADVAEDFEKIFALSGGYSDDGGGGSELQALFEERLRRPMSAPLFARYGANGAQPGRRKFHFQVDAELLVYGATEPGGQVTLNGDPVRLRPDGTFTVRFHLPNCRQVIPAVASSADGVEQQTIVLAVERNTKTMERVLLDGNE